MTTKEEWLARVNRTHRKAPRTLTDIQIRNIRRSRENIPQILKKFNIDRETLRQIRNLEIYQDVF